MPKPIDTMLIERFELLRRIIFLQQESEADDPAERVDIEAQLEYMELYRKVLEQRIKRADPDNTYC